MPKVAAIYLRADHAGEDSTTRVKQLEEEATMRGIVPMLRFIDYSSETAERPEWNALLRETTRRTNGRPGFDLIIFESFENIAPCGAALALRQLANILAAGRHFASRKEGLLCTFGPYGPMATSLIKTFAAADREDLKTRITAGMEKARRAGKKIGRPTVPTDTASLAAMRRAGMSYGRIAEKTGLSKATVHRRLAEVDHA